MQSASQIEYKKKPKPMIAKIAYCGHKMDIFTQRRDREIGIAIASDFIERHRSPEELQRKRCPRTLQGRQDCVDGLIVSQNRKDTEGVASDTTVRSSQLQKKSDKMQMR